MIRTKIIPIWSALAVVGVSATLAPAQAVPVVPNFTQETNDEPHRDNTNDNRDHQFDGLFNWLSIFRNWIRSYRKR